MSSGEGDEGLSHPGTGLLDPLTVVEGGRLVKNNVPGKHLLDHRGRTVFPSLSFIESVTSQGPQQERPF